MDGPDACGFGEGRDDGGFDFGFGGSIMLKIGACKVVVGEAT